MEVFGIILSLFLLMFMAYRGFSVILFAPIFAILAAASQGMSPMPTYTELFMAKTVSYVKVYFPIFMLGAVFGKLMEATGFAKAIALKILQIVGQERAILAVVIAGGVLAYGGVSLFVIVFVLYPFAAALFKQAGIPKRLIPAIVVLGGCTYTMDALPGTPQIQNIIPTNFYGTDVYAAPFIGIIGALLIFFPGMYYLEYRRKKLNAKGEFYGDNRVNEPMESDDSNLPDWKLALLPLVSVLVINFIMTNLFQWNPDLLAPFIGMKLPLVSAAVKNIKAIWALIIAVVIGITLCAALGYRNLQKGGLATALNAGAIGSLLAIMNTASEVGYGNVIASLPGFRSIADALLSIKIGGTPLVSEAVTVTTLAGITGSASGGMSIALDLMAKDWLAWANSIGMSPEILHRVAAMASGGLDSMPHNGAVITILAVCGMTHKEAYPDMFSIVIIKTVAAFAVIAIHLATGIL
ncbi:GntP family permease [Sporomusa malonica]|uniref:H+/gluconate symporter n=1 Tax=Sporomusa malonica TaxID=112901 RepID=A0A1W1Y5Q4_9FIRM|nr:GntP family permease [Sporomusa malonica]SMC31464.1 H+/gluconate symporter [Sporomusa malonica]